MIGNGNEIPIEIIEKLIEDNMIEKNVINSIKENYDKFNIYRIIKRKNKYEIEINNRILIIDIGGNILKIQNT